MISHFMRNIYTIGETVYDIIFKNGKPVSAVPGGAMLNSSVTLGRLGSTVFFISEFGTDPVGKQIEKFLTGNNVSTEYVYRYPGYKSTIALAFLNERNEASYSFYQDYPKERLRIDLPDIEEDDIFLFGSFYALNQQIRKNLIEMLNLAKKRKAIVIYDPNFRESHLDELPVLKQVILENIGFADIVRGSDEDFENIFRAGNSKKAYETFKDKCDCLIYTASEKGVFIHTLNVEYSYPVHTIKPISTIGAGDNFNAGIIYGLISNNIRLSDLNHLTVSDWEPIINTGTTLATEVCLSYDNYISKEFAERFLSKQ